jgi:hypothetical protein
MILRSSRAETSGYHHPEKILHEPEDREAGVQELDG